MTPLSRKDTLTSCQVDEPSMATKSSVSSKRVMITRKSHAAGSTRQSICTSQMYTQTINPHIRAYQKLNVLKATGPTKKEGSLRTGAQCLPAGQPPHPPGLPE